jgi:NADH-quinone oxidoreductase subunit H
MDWFLIISSLIKSAIVLGIVLTLVPISVYLERRVSAVIQDRVGPNRVGLPLTLLGFKKDSSLFGLFQPAADGIKLILKEDFTPVHVKKFYYWLAPALVLIPSIVSACVIPFGGTLVVPDWVPGIAGKHIPLSIANVDAGPLFIFAIASLSVYGIVLAGWSSNSKYPFLGGVRSSAQMISYEIALGLALLPVLLVFGNLNLGEIVEHQSRHGWLLLPVAFGQNEGSPITTAQAWLVWLPAFIAFIIFTVSLFAETKRAPFDLPECETELVAGYHTEYSSMKFALFFMGEYAAMIIGSALTVTLFLGGWSLPFGLDNFLRGADGLMPWWATLLGVGVFLAKVVAFIVFFIWVRWTVPRFRYDQLMKLGWVVFFEAALANVFLTAAILAFFR